MSLNLEAIKSIVREYIDRGKSAGCAFIVGSTRVSRGTYKKIRVEYSVINTIFDDSGAVYIPMWVYEKKLKELRNEKINDILDGELDYI